MRSSLQQLKKMQHDQRGVAALLTVVVVLAFTLSLGLLVSQIAVNEVALSLDADLAEQSFQAGESCAEEAMFRLKRNSSYTGGVITVEDGTCTVTVSGSGSTRTATITSSDSDLAHDFTVNISLPSNTAATADGSAVTNWEEE